MNNAAPQTTTQFGRGVVPCILVLGLVLGCLCAKSFQPDQVIFSNDGPLGAAKSAALALPAALNSNFFSNTCWGLGSRAVTLGAVFLALALLQARRVGNPWLNAALAGLVVGMAVVEGADIGVIFSLFVAAFVLVQSWIE